MMEAEKILHIKKYVTLLQTRVRSHLARSQLHTCNKVNSPRAGYILPSIPQQCIQMHLRPKNYAATCTKIFSTVAQSSIDDIDQKLMLLCSDEKKGQVSVDDLKEILMLCDYKLHDNTGMLLLKCCGNLSTNLNIFTREKLINQIWNLVQKNNKITLDHYNTLLHVHMENSISIDPAKFLDDMTVEPDENTYCSLINMVARMGNSNLWNITSVIKKKDIFLNENTLNTLIQIYVSNGNIAEAEHIITHMQNAKLSTAKAYTELACGYAKLGDIPNLIKILNEESQNDANLFRITKILSSSDNSRHIPVILNFMTGSALTNESEISKLITELIHTDQITGAFTIINHFALNDATKDIARNFINIFLNGLIIVKAPTADIIEYATNFMNLGFEPLALSNIAEISLKLGREKLCYAIFDVMKKNGIEIRAHYYWPLLTIAHYQKGEAKILSILRSMRDAHVELDFDTLFNFVYPYINTINPNITLQRMVTENISTSTAFYPLVAFLLSNNRLHEAIILCKCTNHKINYNEFIKFLVQAYFETRDVQNCVTFLMIHSYAQPFISLFLKMLLIDKAKFHTIDLQLFLEEFNNKGAKISSKDADFLKNRLNYLNIKDNDIFKLLDSLIDEEFNESVEFMRPINPKYMNIKNLECFLVELENKKMSTGYILRKLFESYCNENKLSKAEVIKRELDAIKYNWTYGMKIHLFELYVRNNKLDEANTILSHIHEKFQIDNIKVLMFATALVKANKPIRAFEIIEQINRINFKFNAQKHCYILLDTIAHSQYYNQTLNMMKLLVDKKYCKVSNELLRPLVAIPLERNNIPQTMKVFRTCAQKYQKIPLALEILITLLKYRNSSENSVDKYINEVYTTIIDLHHTKMANTILAIALASLDQKEELKDLLQKQQLSISTLVRFSSYTQRCDTTDSLLKIFEEMSMDNLNQIILCDLLINIYNKTGDFKGALNLWNKMHAKNLKFTEQSKQSFIQLLLLNKVSLPPEFKEENSENVSNQ